MTKVNKFEMRFCAFKTGKFAPMAHEKASFHISCDLCHSRGHSAFKELNPDQFSDLDEHKVCTFFKRGQILAHEGSRPGGVFCIHKGKVKVYKMGVEGREQIIRFGKDGEMVAYRSVLSGEPLQATVEAIDDTHACFVPKSLLFKFLEENPKFSLEMMRMACHELGEAGRLITNLAQKSVRERLAETILMLNRTFGEDRNGFIDIVLTREELSNMVGTATESVIRLMTEFKNDGMIEVEGRHIKIKKPDALARTGAIFD
jgi:CRP-like cAMP-binding protein